MTSPVQPNFPDVGGFVLSGRRVRLPRDFPPDALIVVAFQRWHQRLVDEWIAWSAEQQPQIPVIEVPVLSRAYLVSRPFIDGGMIAGIRDKAVLSRTITVYTDAVALRAALGIPDASTVAAIRWASSAIAQVVVGPVSDEAATRLLGQA